MADRTLVDLARYNRWATERVLDAASRLEPERRREPAPGTAGTIQVTIAHLAGVERWFTALIPDRPFEPPPEDPPWEELTRFVLADADALVELIESLDDEALDRLVDRHGYRMLARDLVLQALTHSHQHRTQVAAAVDVRGVPVTATDYYDWVVATEASTSSP